MTIDNNGSFLREPVISEDGLRKRVEKLARIVPINRDTQVRRSARLDSEALADLDYRRSKKELEASLGHQIDSHVDITLQYNPAWEAFEARELIFSLPGTTSLTAHVQYDSDSHSYASHLYDDTTEQQIARKPVQLSTIDTILSVAGVQPRVAATTAQELITDVFQSSRPDEEISIIQKAVVFEDETADVTSFCHFHREQTYTADDIIDVIRFITDISTGDSTHARVISLISSQHGSMISVEEINQVFESDVTTRRTVELDYETIEKLLKHVQIAIDAVETKP